MADDPKFDAQFYGETATEWLKRWDNGDIVWSIEMGGMGPGYEQCIQITAAEILRYFIASACDAAKWDDKGAWAKDRDGADAVVFKVPAVKDLGLSGAQWGAAMSLASFIYKNGPIAMMKDGRVKDRHIQVQRNFPQAVA